MTVILLLIIFGIAAGFLYAYVKRIFSYWERLGLPFIVPKIPHGNINGCGSNERFDQMIAKYYRSMKGKGPFGGIYFFAKPVILMLDMKMIDHMLVKDFQYFCDRQKYSNELEDPMSVNLYSVDGDRWRQLKNKFSTLFTETKMKIIFSTIMRIVKNFEDCLSGLVKDEEMLEIRGILSRYSIDVIGSCAFGAECNSLANPNETFFLMAKKSRELRYPSIERLFIENYQFIAKRLGLAITNPEASEYFQKTICETVYQRESKGKHHSDFIDFMINLKLQSFDSMSINEMAAQSFQFIKAGFDTTAETMAFALYELAMNPEVQDKLRNHIKMTVAKNDGKMSYDTFMDMYYLEQVIKETLRKYPSVGVITRTLNKDYQFPGSLKKFAKGTKFCISVYGIHHDSDYYSDPERFDPNRFSTEKSNVISTSAFLAFGLGPRSCIGLHFAMIQMKIGLASLIANYEFSKCSSTPPYPIPYSKETETLTPDGGLWLNIKKVTIKGSKIPVGVPVRRMDIFDFK